MASNKNKPFEQAVKTLSTAVFKRGMIIAWVTLIVALTITGFYWYYAKKSIEDNANERFNNRINDISLSIIKRMQHYEQVLKGGLGLFHAMENITKEDWRNYISSLNIDESYPGILGIGFTKIIEKKDLQTHINQIRKEGYPNYRIWPEGDRDIYTSIIFLEPFNKKNQRAFGYDMFSEPVRKKAMEFARDYGKTAVSNKVTLVQEVGEDIQAGFLMYLPLYDRKMGVTTIAERKKAIVGYVYGPFRMKDLIESIFSDQLQNIKLEIYDGHISTGENLMYTSHTKEQLTYTERNIFERYKTININEADWTLKFTSLPGFEATIDRQKPLIVLILGIIVSSLLFIIARNLGNIFIINKKLEQLLESTIEGIYGIDRKGRCTFINDSAAAMIGYNAEECLKKNMHDLIHHHKENSELYLIHECPIIKSMEEKKGCAVDSDVFWKKDGTSFPVEYSSYPIIDDEETTGAVIVFTDITERRKSLEQIENSLKEKEVLLREIHHRVKNNLQIISSMLNLQTSYITDAKSLAIFEESRNRVKSMALIHEKLYQNESLSSLNLKDYVNELVSYLMRSYRIDSRIDSEVNISDIFITTDTAVPLGLIINELISNSLKYAFPKDKTGIIYVSIIPITSNKFQMIIEDNGVGIPEDFNLKTTNTLGLQLVNSLVTQLDGEIKLSNTTGTKVEITFKGMNLNFKKNKQELKNIF